MSRLEKFGRRDAVRRTKVTIWKSKENAVSKSAWCSGGGKIATVWCVLGTRGEG